MSENKLQSVDGTGRIGNLGFNLGLDYYFNSKWSLKVRMGYDPKGFSFITSEVTLDYFTVPVLANWHFGIKKRWYLHFGPYFGYLISDNLDGALEFRELDYGANVGLGIKIPIGNLNFFIESDLQSSLREVFDDGKNLSNQLIQRNAISLGMIIGNYK